MARQNSKQRSLFTGDSLPACEEPSAQFASERTMNSFAEFEPKVLVGDCQELLPRLDPESVQCCITSPPYWGLRDYDHPNQIGAEPSPDQYVEKLLILFREVRRVLRKDGTLWLNIGDGYARNGGTGNCGPNAIVANTKKLIQRRNCKVLIVGG